MITVHSALTFAMPVPGCPTGSFLHFVSLLVTKILTDLGQARHTVQADHVM